MTKHKCSTDAVSHYNRNQHNVGKNAGEYFPWYTNSSYTAATFFRHFIVCCGWHWLSSTRWHRENVSISSEVLSQRFLLFIYIYSECDTVCVLCTCSSYIFKFCTFLYGGKLCRHIHITDIFWNFLLLLFTVGWQICKATKFNWISFFDRKLKFA